jgi:HSP20 family protein
MATRSVFDDFLNLHRNFDTLFDRVLRNVGGPLLLPSVIQTGTMAGLIPPAEAFLRDGTFVLRVYLPGLRPENVDLSTVNNQITIRGEWTPSAEVKADEYLLREFPYGSFERTFALPEGCETDKVSAAYNNGVLELTVPVAAKTLPRKIQIQAGKEQPRLGKSAA